MKKSTSLEGDSSEMIVKRVSVPIGLEELMEGLAKEVLRNQPEDLYLFSAKYFSHLLLLRDKGNIKVKTVRSAQTVIEANQRRNSKKPPPAVNTKQLSRQFSIRKNSESSIEAPLSSFSVLGTGHISSGHNEKFDKLKNSRKPRAKIQARSSTRENSIGKKDNEEQTNISTSSNRPRNKKEPESRRTSEASAKTNISGKYRTNSSSDSQQSKRSSDRTKISTPRKDGNIEEKRPHISRKDKFKKTNNLTKEKDINKSSFLQSIPLEESIKDLEKATEDDISTGTGNTDGTYISGYDSGSVSENKDNSDKGSLDSDKIRAMVKTQIEKHSDLVTKEKQKQADNSDSGKSIGNDTPEASLKQIDNKTQLVKKEEKEMRSDEKDLEGIIVYDELEEKHDKKNLNISKTSSEKADEPDSECDTRNHEKKRIPEKLDITENKAYNEKEEEENVDKGLEEAGRKNINVPEILTKKGDESSIVSESKKTSQGKNTSIKDQEVEDVASDKMEDVHIDKSNDLNVNSKEQSDIEDKSGSNEEGIVGSLTKENMLSDSACDNNKKDPAVREENPLNISHLKLITKDEDSNDNLSKNANLLLSTDLNIQESNGEKATRKSHNNNESIDHGESKMLAREAVSIATSNAVSNEQESQQKSQSSIQNTENQRNQRHIKEKSNKHSVDILRIDDYGGITEIKQELTSPIIDGDLENGQFLQEQNSLQKEDVDQKKSPEPTLMRAESYSRACHHTDIAEHVGSVTNNETKQNEIKKSLADHTSKSEIKQYDDDLDEDTTNQICDKKSDSLLLNNYNKGQVCSIEDGTESKDGKLNKDIDNSNSETTDNFHHSQEKLNKNIENTCPKIENTKVSKPNDSSANLSIEKENIHTDNNSQMEVMIMAKKEFDGEQKQNEDNYHAKSVENTSEINRQQKSNEKIMTGNIINHKTEDKDNTITVIPDTAKNNESFMEEPNEKVSDYYTEQTLDQNTLKNAETPQQEADANAEKSSQNTSYGDNQVLETIQKSNPHKEIISEIDVKVLGEEDKENNSQNTNLHQFSIDSNDSCITSEVQSTFHDVSDISTDTKNKSVGSSNTDSGNSNTQQISSDLNNEPKTEEILTNYKKEIGHVPDNCNEKSLEDNIVRSKTNETRNVIDIGSGNMLGDEFEKPVVSKSTQENIELEPVQGNYLPNKIDIMAKNDTENLDIIREKRSVLDLVDVGNTLESSTTENTKDIKSHQYNTEGNNLSVESSSSTATKLETNIKAHQKSRTKVMKFLANHRRKVKVTLLQR